MKKTRIKRMAVSASLVALLSFLPTGCSNSHSHNASKQQVMPGHQPNPAYDANGVKCDRLGENEFLMSLRRVPDVDMQENSTWCWAAATASLINYDSGSATATHVTQDDVIRAMAAHKSNQSANEMDIIRALTWDMGDQLKTAKTAYYAKPHQTEFADLNPLDSSRKNDTSHGYYQAKIPPLPGSSGLVDEIIQGRPAIVAIDPTRGEMGHVVTAVAVRFSVASTDVTFGTTSPYFVREIIAIDPATGKQTSYRAIEATENGEKSAIDRVAFAMSRETAREYVKELITAYRTAKWVTPTQAPVVNSNGNRRTIHLFGSH